MYTSKTFEFIETACHELDYNSGDLITLSDASVWQKEEKIDWIKLCESVDEDLSHNTEKIFFVNEEPLIIFTKVQTNTGFYKVYNRIWCMARPRLLFLETMTELLVLDLAKPPMKSDEELIDDALVIVKNVAEIKVKLSEYRREQIESGKTFEDIKFADIESRADRSLIRDLKIVRQKLYEAGLQQSHLKYAHSLIGKSIFIRYLEDRKILSKEYFLDIAKGNNRWEKLLNSTASKPFADSAMGQFVYPRVLADKNFTYAVYKKIAEDFNGDIFPTDESEKHSVSAKHLSILQSFLDGSRGNDQLFFWAYRFDIIPIELISNIYEEFYHYNTEELADEDGLKGIDNKGTYYTPAPLVEFVLRRTLTEKILKTDPVVLDPACGSGIFLVETYRKIVRYKLFSKNKRQLNRAELLAILKHQIRGIELNEEAVKIAAFSLYLAFLHYQTPPDILFQIKKGRRLPHLILSQNKSQDEQYFDILLQANAFEVNQQDNSIQNLKFGSNCADVIVGNPPWGSPPKNDKDGRIALSTAMNWCIERNLPTSDMERSQAFIWRANDLLKVNGCAGLLVSSGILLKQSDKSNLFKQAWLNSVTLKEVVNFIHVRDVFFNGAISPFLSILFKKSPPQTNDSIDYWTARRTKIIEHTKAIILDKTDFKFFSFGETQFDDIWKIFYFGNHRDLSLINKLRVHQQLENFEYVPVEGARRRQGFIEGNKKLDADWLEEYRELPAGCFNDRYTSIPFSKVLKDVPSSVKERGAKHIFEGKRILIGKISQKTEPKGQIIARLESRKFSFRNTINCIKLKEEYKEYYDVILGILWSSLARYYFFLTASKWGVWHDQVYADEILRLPVVLPKNGHLHDKISVIVTQLRKGEFDKQYRNAQPDLFTQDAQRKIYGKTQKQLETELDKGIFQLYKLSESEIDLIHDRCAFDIDFFYNDSKSIAVSKVKSVNNGSGEISSIPVKRSAQKGLDGYLKTFISVWEPEIEEHKKLTYRIIYPSNSPLIAVAFDLTDIDKSPSSIKSVETEWKKVLSTIDQELRSHYSSTIYIDGIARILTNKQIIIIKRDEQRLWTHTAAREDAEATILQAMLKQEQSHA
ncbi:MAG: hypothetical protein JWN78_1962 [Bacteroidota bacterium]|nr:hypothetical protein [Bacteroidota bacterium]